jgi:predicted transcriptional regulator
MFFAINRVLSLDDDRGPKTLGGQHMVDAFTQDPRNLRLKDCVISDEYQIIDANEDLKGAIGTLLSMNYGVLLVKDGKEIKGVVTERKILKKIADVKDPFTLKVKDLMDTKILKIDGNEKLPKALDQIAEGKPAAVIVLGKDGEFKGYFSPMDYLQAERMLKAAKKRGKIGAAPEGEDELGEK